MVWRVLMFSLLQLACAAAGGLLLGPWGVVGGVVLAAWLAFGWETWSGQRVIRWLRGDGAASSAPVLRGLWGEAAARMRRSSSAIIAGGYRPGPPPLGGPPTGKP